MSIALAVNTVTGGPSTAQFQAFNALIPPRLLNIAMYYQSFPAEPVIYSSQYATCAALGIKPQSVWQPAGVGIVASINAGTNDAYITGEALGVVAAGVPVQIRLMHECNGNFTAYGPSSCTDAQYIAAFRRIVTRFRAAGATNVEWIWTPNIWLNSAGTIADPSLRYPGDAYVDTVGLDGYQTLLNGSFQTFRQLFIGEYAVLRNLAPSKRFCIGETGQGEVDARGSRVTWWQGLQSTLVKDMPAVSEFGIFNRLGGAEGDYTIDVSGTNAASLAAIRSILNNPPFSDLAGGGGFGAQMGDKFLARYESHYNRPGYQPGYKSTLRKA